MPQKRKSVLHRYKEKLDKGIFPSLFLFHTKRVCNYTSNLIPVGDGENSFIFEFFSDSFLQKHVGLMVDACCGLINA